jgi:hypothetical protein
VNCPPWSVTRWCGEPRRFITPWNNRAVVWAVGSCSPTHAPNGMRENTSRIEVTLETTIRKCDGTSMMSIIRTWPGRSARTARPAAGDAEVGGLTRRSLWIRPTVRFDSRHPARARVRAMASSPPKPASPMACTTPRTASA